MTLKKKKLFGGTIQFPCPRFCSVLLGCHPIQDAFKVLKSLTQAGPQFPTVSKLSKVDRSLPAAITGVDIAATVDSRCKHCGGNTGGLA